MTDVFSGLIAIIFAFGFFWFGFSALGRLIKWLDTVTVWQAIKLLLIVIFWPITLPIYFIKALVGAVTALMDRLTADEKPRNGDRQ